MDDVSIKRTGQNDILDRIIENIRKPLHFASKDSFARINAVKSLEPLIAGLCNEAVSSPIPSHTAMEFERLRLIFSGFDSLTPEMKKEKVSTAQALIESIARAQIAPFDPPVSPSITNEEVKRRLAALATPLQFVKGVGPKLAEMFAGKGLRTVEDMLYFLPIRYEDRRNIKKIKDLTPGADEVVIGVVLASGEAYYGRRRVFEAAIDDGTGVLKAKWFHFKSQYMQGRFKKGARYSLFGRVSAYGRQMEMIHPDVELIEDTITDKEDASMEHGQKAIVPVYSQIENFHQKTVRKIASCVVEKFAESALDGAPYSVRTRHGLMSASVAFRSLHSPVSIDCEAAKRSLAFDELFLLELGLAMKRSAIKGEPGISFKKVCADGAKSALGIKLRSKLPFRLTRAQENVLSEIRSDMAKAHPMNRLLQGDVGSGKTVVSLITALWAIESGYQAAIMAPTEILAEQHYLTIHRYAEALGVSALLLTGRMKKSERDAKIAHVRSGKAQLIVGTHALIQKDVLFEKLGLVVIDEQHRFGVVQRAELRKKAGDAGLPPDVLIMTATPIPRTLSMTVFGDLDVSVIDELPPGRTPIKTRIIREKERGKAYEAIRSELKSGRQCYIVYPLVEESEELSLKDATRMKEHLEKDIFREFKVGLMHGRLKSDEKEEVMSGFKAGAVDILVATTVIEVGVDVPNATVILIEHAEMFGLAQLHQLRGRVGRGDKPSLCLLLAAWTQSEDTYRRLKVMEETMDGFRIAEHDLKIRGPGSFIGTKQSGLLDFRTTFALGDLTLLTKARSEALLFLKDDPHLKGEEGSAIRAILRARWAGRLDLAEVG